MAQLTHDEAEDEDALAHLEANIKSLRRLERALFPAILPQVAPELRGEEHGEASEVITPPSDGAPIGTETLQPPEDAVAEGAAEQVDRADE